MNEYRWYERELMIWLNVRASDEDRFDEAIQRRLRLSLENLCGAKPQNSLLWTPEYCQKCRR